MNIVEDHPMTLRDAKIEYACEDGADLISGEYALGPLVKPELRAMVYTFDAYGTAVKRGWMHFNSELDYIFRYNKDRHNPYAYDGRWRQDWFRVHMPYLITPLSEFGIKHFYLPLNRHYKPLGVPSDVFVDYEAYSKNAIRFARSPATFNGVWLSDQTQGLYLYQDGGRPFDYPAYFARLAKLFSYKATT